MKWSEISGKLSCWIWRIFLIWGSVGVLAALFRLKLPDWMDWADAFCLILAGIVTYFSLIEREGLSRARTTATLILILSALLELIAVNTGHPFGSYSYTDRLSWIMLASPWWEGIPFVIPVAWFVVSVNAFYVSQVILRTRHHYLVIGGAATLALATDYNLEPVAWYMRGYSEAYWRWTTETIPWNNYASWFVATAVMLLLCPLRTQPINRMDMRPFIILGGINVLFLAVRLSYWIHSHLRL